MTITKIERARVFDVKSSKKEFINFRNEHLDLCLFEFSVLYFILANLVRPTISCRKKDQDYNQQLH